MEGFLGKLREPNDEKDVGAGKERLAQQGLPIGIELPMLQVASSADGRKGA